MFRSELWDSLLANFAMASLIPVIWDVIKDRGATSFIDRFSIFEKQAAFGFTMGVFAVVSMVTAKPVLPGFVIDLRSALIALAGLFGGFPAAILAALLAGGARLYIGGSGVAGGLAILPVAAFVGIYAHRRCKLQKAYHFLIFGLFVGASAMVGYLVTCALAGSFVFSWTVAPVFTMNAFAALLLGIAINYRIRDLELSETRAILAAMVEELPDCLNVKDLQGRFLVANAATARLMGRTSSNDLIGRTDFDFYPAEIARRYRQDEENFIKTDAARRIDQPYVFSDGRDGWLATLKAPHRDENGRLVGVITHNRDVTDEKRALTVKNDFVSTVSHELRTPLTSIRGALGLIMGGAAGELPPKAASLLRVAHSNSERLVKLINDILDIERMSSGAAILSVQRTAIAQMIDEAVSASENYLPDRKVGLVVTLMVQDVEADLDPDRFRQVLDNLISNAIKYSPVGGEVTIQLRRLNSDFLRLSVFDQGVGIPIEFRGRIFGKFERSDSSDTRAIGGTGLGLSIAKTIIEQHGGKIGFQDRETGGTEFFIDFPAIEEKVGGEPMAPTGHAVASILYVENDEDLARIIKGGLHSNISLQRVGTLEAARDALVTCSYDLVVIDILLPDGNGLHLLSDIPLTTSAMIYSSVDADEPFARPVDATFVKTRTSEVDVLKKINDLIDRRLCEVDHADYKSGKAA